MVVGSFNDIYVIGASESDFTSPSTSMHTLLFRRSLDQGHTFSVPTLVTSTPEFTTLESEHLLMESSGAIDIVAETDYRDQPSQVTVRFARSLDNGNTFALQTLTTNGELRHWQ